MIDDFRTGREEFLERFLDRSGATLVRADVRDRKALRSAVEGCDWVFHLQANADVRHGLDHPMRDLEQNTVATAELLDVMRDCDVTQIAFASTGSVYGEPAMFPTPEDAPFPVQTSLYAASKLACEGLISAYSAGYAFTAVIFRFVSILGERYTHGHVYDFYRSLRADPEHLTVLGDGKQEKSYLYVQDCVSGMLTAAAHHDGRPGVEIYNLGTDETLLVDDSISIITAHMRVAPAIRRTGGRRGWVGDSPLIRLDTSKIKTLGWKPQVTIADAVKRTLGWFDVNEYIWSEPTRTEDATGR